MVNAIDKVRDVLNAIEKIEIDMIQVDNYDMDSDTVIKLTILCQKNKVQTIKPIKIKNG